MKKLLLPFLVLLNLSLILTPYKESNAEILSKHYTASFWYLDKLIQVKSISTDSNNRLYLNLTAYHKGRQIANNSEFIYTFPPVNVIGKGYSPEDAFKEIVGESLEIAYKNSNLSPLPAYFLTITIYPDPNNPATTAADGDMGTNGNASYSSAHSTADCTDCSGSSLLTTENSASSIGSVDIPGCGVITTTYSVIRSLINFDTSTLGTGATISAATLSIKPALTPTDYTGVAYVRIVTNSITSATTYTTSDFNSFNTTAQATDINLSSMSSGTYADFSLNATGISNISKTGVSKFGARIKGDIDNTTPVPTTPAQPDCLVYSSDGAIVYWYGSETASTTSDPKLVVTYTTTTSSPKKRIINMN